MWKRFDDWVHYFLPSIVLIGEMIALFFLVRYILFDLVWPYLYQNGEPIVSGLQSTAQSRIQERLTFQATCRYWFTAMGIAALGAYVIYLLLGLPHMPHNAHVSLCKHMRGALCFGFLATWVKVVTNLFVVRGCPVLLGLFGTALCMFSLISFLVNYFKLWLDTCALETDRMNKLLGSLLLCLFLVGMIIVSQTPETVVSFIVLIKDIIQSTFNSEAIDVAGHFALATGFDYLLPMAFLWLQALLFIGMRFASPIRANAAMGKGVTTLVNENGLMRRRDI